MNATNTMTTGYVFTIAPNLFGIFLFAKPFLMCRFDDADDIDEACLSFSMKFAGYFKPITPGIEKVARDMMRRRDTLVLTDN